MRRARLTLFLKKNKLFMMKKILVVRYGALGDTIVTLPVLQSLKESGYSVTMAGNSRYGDFLLKYGHIDGFISFDGELLLPLFTGEGEDSLARYLEQFDLVLAYTDEFEPFSAGLKKSFTGKILFHPSGPSRVHEHIISYLLKPVRDIAARIIEIPEISIKGSATEKYFVIHPGSGSVHKNWSKEHFLSLYRHLSQDLDGCILLGYAEEDMKNFWYDNVPAEKIVQSSDMTTLLNLGAKAALYVGNDSGISHFFSAAGVRTAVIFGPTSPALWSPMGKDVRIVCKNIGCSPCDTAARASCIEKTCLTSISFRDVKKALKG